MKAIMVMFDSLNRHMLSPYGCQWTHTPNFARLAKHSVQFENCYVGSMPCMPARRDLHTGRLNFLHRSWGPLEPYDDSMPEILSNHGIHSHLSTDHYHYFEDGGATYHHRYTTWEGFRGQEADPWKCIMDFDTPPTRNGDFRNEGGWLRQDFVNRTFMDTPEKQSQALTFTAGLEFIEKNHASDDWFLHIETFDPHEPYFSHEKYKALLPDDGYDGPIYDWPDYRKLNSGDDDVSVQHLRREYAALLAMCDDYLGRVLDAMDEHNLWEDTMLIVNTDHGFLLSEHELWAKCHCPFYGEVAHTPLFIWDPRSRRQDVIAKSLVQSIDLPATLLDFFGIPLPKDMQGIPLGKTIAEDTPVREAALFGLFGTQVNCTDGRYVYMRSPSPGNKPLHQYMLMPTGHYGHRGFIPHEELTTITLHEGFSYTKSLRLMRTTPADPWGQRNYPTLLFDLEIDPGQLHPIEDAEVEAMMIAHMKRLMAENDAPPEQFERMGL